MRDADLPRLHRLGLAHVWHRLQNKVVFWLVHTHRDAGRKETKMIACTKHKTNPVKGYHACPGCEVEALRTEVEQLRKEIEQFKNANDLNTKEVDVPKCACCGTRENLHRDLGSGGPYRCNSPACTVF